MDEKWGRCELWKYVQPPSQLCSFGLRLWTACTLIALADMLQAGIRTSIHLQWWVAFLQLLLRASLGLVLNALGETRSCDSTVCGPCFFLQASVDWFGWAPLAGLSWIHWYLQGSLNCPPFHFTMHLPHTHLLSMGLNVAKCNWGEAKHDTMLASSCHY